MQSDHHLPVALRHQGDQPEQSGSDPSAPLPGAGEERLTLDDLPVGILVCDALGSIRASNAEAVRLLGGADPIGKQLLDLCRKADDSPASARATVGCPVQRAVLTRQRVDPVLIELRDPPMAATVRLWVSALPKLSPDGEIITINCSLQPAERPVEHETEALFIQQAINRAKQEWVTTVDAIPDLIFLEDSEGNLLRCNKAATEFFQMSYTEILSKRLTDLFFPAVLPSALQNPFRRGITEIQFPERPEWYEVVSCELARPSELAAGRVHVIRDITTRKKAEVTLHQLNTIIEQTAESILIADSTGIVQYINPTYEATTGWKREEAIGRHFLTMGGQTSKLSFYEKAMDALSTGRPWRDTHTARRKDGSPYEEEITVSPIRNASGNLLNYIAISRDITEKRRLEAIAEAVNMMENVGYIFSGIRHELGNPINSVKTALSVLIRNLEEWPRQQIGAYVNRVIIEIQRVEYLLKALKTFSMHENPVIKRLDPIAFLQNFFSLVESDFEKRGIRLQASLDPHLGACLADPRALHQVLLNLFANAADALLGRPDPTIRLTLQQQGKMIEIKVIDNGIGMDESQQRSLFKPFHTSKTSGTGLGLVIVKKMMVKMNGMIHITSQYKVGTQVSLLLEAVKGD